MTITATKLQEWANDHEPDENLIYKNGYWEQIMFIRDRVSGILASSTEEYREIISQIEVISTHMSKSVLLPVFRIVLNNGIMFTMRYNFYDWKVSVSSPNGVNSDFMGLFDPTQKILSVYCEGFPKECVYGLYEENPKEFTVEIASDYHLFVFFWIFAREHLGKKP